MIISTSIILILVALLVGFYMAWNIGANDVANSMSTAVGAKAITLKQAVVIAAVLEAAGAILVGSSVADTVKKGVIDPQVFGPSLFILGSLSAILAASIWVTISTWKEMPISTTHSIIGSLIGFGIISGSMGLVPGGVGVVGWGKVGHIALGWVISPFMAALIAYIVFRIIVRLMFENERPDEAARKRSPIFLGATIFLVVISFLLKTPFGKSLGVADNVPMALGIALLAAIASSYLGYIFLILPAIAKAKDTDGDYARVEIVFRRLQIITSCYVAFAHGANDVANAIGPVAGVIQASQGTMEAKVAIPLYLLLIGAAGIAIGVFTWGYKVMKTVGFKITELTNTRGFSVDFGAATTVLLASKMGLPVSTTHAVVGAVMGVGLARGIGAVDFGVLKKIVISWAITLPIAALTAIGIFLLLWAVIPIPFI